MSQNPRLSAQDVKRRNQGDDPKAIARGAAALLGVLNPVVLLVVLLTVGFGQKKLRGRWVSGAGAALLVISSLFGAVRAYFTPWRELAGFFRENGGLLAARGMKEFVLNNASAWISAQIPFGAAVGLLIAGVLIWKRGKFNAQWRDEEPELHTMSPNEARALNARVERKKKKMPQWANPKPVQRLDDVAVRLGVSKPGCAPVDVPLSALRLHSMVFGPSGFGKTTTIFEVIKGLTLAPAAQPFRIGTIFLTMKPEADITEQMRAVAQRTGRGFHVITQNGRGATTTYNPLKHGTSHERANILVEAEANAAHGGFSEAHYQRLGLRFTMVALEALEAAVQAKLTYREDGQPKRWRLDIAHVARMMTTESLESVRNALGGEPAAVRINKWLNEVATDSVTESGAAGMRSRFAVVAEGAAGAVLVDEPGGLDLEQAIVNGDFVVFNLDAAQDLEAAQFVANLAISDFVSTIARLGHEGWHIDPATGQQNRLNLLVVDEFAALGATGLIDAVERSRSHGAAVMLSAQSYTGLSVVGDGFLERVSASTSVKLIHRAEAEAEALAQLIGTRKGFAETTQTFEDIDGLGSQLRASGQGSLREVDKFRVHPNTFRSLAPGEVVAMWSVPSLHAEVVSVRKTGLPPVDDEPAGEPERQQRPEPEAEAQGSAGGKDDDEMWGWS